MTILYRRVRKNVRTYRVVDVKNRVSGGPGDLPVAHWKWQKVLRLRHIELHHNLILLNCAANSELTFYFRVLLLAD